MGKEYKANIEGLAIEDGVLVNCQVTDNFTSKHADSGVTRTMESATFDLSGIDVETVVQFLWDQFKVKAQARSWKNMSNRDFEAMAEGVQVGIDFIPKADRTSTKTAILNKAQAHQQKKFYEKALEKAVDQLDEDASQEDIIAWAQQYYDDEYKDIIESMAD